MIELLLTLALVLIGAGIIVKVSLSKRPAALPALAQEPQQEKEIVQIEQETYAHCASAIRKAAGLGFTEVMEELARSEKGCGTAKSETLPTISKKVEELSKQVDNPPAPPRSV